MTKTKQEKLFDLIEERMRMGCTIVHICKKHNISPFIFGYWQRKYNNNHKAVSEFIPVNFPESKATGKCLKIVYPNSVTIEIENCDNFQLVKQLINLC